MRFVQLQKKVCKGTCKNRRQLNIKLVLGIYVTIAKKKKNSKKQYLCKHVKYAQKGIEPSTKPEQKTCFPCKDCDFVGETNYIYQQHIKSLHPRDTCNACGFRALSHYAIRRHKEDQHGEVAHNCPHCEGTFGQKQFLKMHMQEKQRPQDYHC